MKKGVVGTVIAAVVGAVVLIGRVLWDVFSWAGIGYAFGLSDGADLAFPTATAVVFWLLATLVPFEATVLVVKRLDWREAVLEPGSPVDAWLAAHISFRRRVHRRIVWLRDGVKVSFRQFKRAVELASTPATPAVTFTAVDTAQPAEVDTAA